MTLRVLMVSQMVPYLPSRDGFRVIPAHLLRCLAERHEFHLVSLSDGGETAAELAWAKDRCRSVEVVSGAAPPPSLLRALRTDGTCPPDLVAAVTTRLRDLDPDVLHLEGPGVAPLVSLAGGRVLRVVSAHDALSLRYRDFARFAPGLRARLSFSLRAVLARRFERRFYGRADRVVVTSPLDSAALGDAAPPDRILVIPNGVDLREWAYSPAPTPGRIVFTGNMAWPPNEDAAEQFARRVLPLVRRDHPGAEFVAAGAEPSPRVRALAELPGVRVTGTVPDLREWIRSASVYVSPLRFGAGVKNKILEAMALGAPIVATPPSLTGTPLEAGRHLLLAEQPSDLAQAVSAILADPELGRRLSRAAREEVERNHSWEVAAGRFADIYDSARGIDRGAGR